MVRTDIKLMYNINPNLANNSKHQSNRIAVSEQPQTFIVNALLPGQTAPFCCQETHITHHRNRYS